MTVLEGRRIPAIWDICVPFAPVVVLMVLFSL